MKKQCNTCLEVMPFDKFPLDPTCKDGHKYSCRTCTSERNRQRYLAKKAQGIVRSRKKAAHEPLWPLPTHSILEGLDCVRLRNWRGPVNHEPMRARL